MENNTSEEAGSAGTAATPSTVSDRTQEEANVAAIFSAFIRSLRAPEPLAAHSTAQRAAAAR